MMPNAAETIERLARESERQKIEIESLLKKNEELVCENKALKAELEEIREIRK